MGLAWGQAIQHNYDFYIWLNDDVELGDDAISRIIHFYRNADDKKIGVVTGSTVSKDHIRTI